MSVVREYVVEVDCPTVEIEVQAASPEEAIALGRAYLRDEAESAELTLRHGRISDVVGTPRIVGSDEADEAPAHAGPLPAVDDRTPDNDTGDERDRVGSEGVTS